MKTIIEYYMKIKGKITSERARRGRHREHSQTSKGSPTGDGVTSGEMAPLGRILHNFRLRTIKPKGTTGARHVTFGHATS